MFKNQTLILGGSVIIALLGLGFFFFLRPTKKVKALTDSEKKDLSKSAFASETDDTHEADIASPNKGGSVVLDEGDDDDDEDDDDGEAALKTAYDDALRLAKKLLNGNKFTKAAEKFTEAIDLAEKIPSAGKDIITLYNNRR
jgi:hypothetical protein